MDSPYVSVVINHGGDELMAVLMDVRDKVAGLTILAQQVLARVMELKAQVAAGGAVTEADLDQVIADLMGVETPMRDALA